MPEDIYELSTYKIKATLKEGGLMSKSYTGKLDLSYKKGDTVLHSETDIDVTKGSVNKEYTLPAVESTEENYNFKIVAKYGKTKEKTRVLAEAVVWPKSMKLTVKDSKDDALVKHLAYKIVHDKGSATKGHTGDDGVGQEDLKKCAYAVEINAPWELVSNKNDTHKREHDVVVRNNPEAKFLKPDLTKACYIAATTEGKDKGVRQYVNVVSTEEGADANGHIVEFEVCHKNKPQGINGDKIYIKVTFSKVSKRDTPKPALLAPAQSIVEKDSGKTFTGFVQLGAAGGSAKFKVQFGLAGGETVTVSCGYSAKDPTDAEQIFVTWRKLGYQIRFPEVLKARMLERTREDASKYFDIPDSIFDFAKERLAPVFIEYANIKSNAYPDPAVGSPCLMTKGFLNSDADTTPIFVLDGRCHWAVGATAFGAAADNREIHVTLCDAAVSSGGDPLAPDIKLSAVETTKAIDTDSGNLYFAKTHKAANTDNLKLAGYKWVADLRDVADTDKLKRPLLTVATIPGNGGGPKSYTIHEPLHGGPAITVTLNDADALPDLEKAKVQSYYDACYGDHNLLRRNENKLKFNVVGSNGQPGDDTRKAAVQDALFGIHGATDKKVLFHPAVAEDGTSRTGPMTDVTITHVDSRKKKFVFKSRATDVDPLLPGDFVGAPSAAKCPVWIQFSMDGTYEINGNAGGGEQLLVLRTTVPGPCSSTICHELGHAMGMSIMGTIPVPSGLPKPKHVDNGGTYYLDGSAPFSGGIRDLHRGPHCCDGMPSGKRSDPVFKKWSPGASDTVCIMWGSGGDEDNRKKYCTVCTNVLKARQLTDVRSAWEGRADG